MSSEESVVVEQVETPVTKKDPKKVEQGKRLAMIGKEAKERKMRDKIESEMRDLDSTWSRKAQKIATNYIFPITTVAACGTTLYFWSKSRPSVEVTNIDRVVVEPPKPEPKKPRKTSFEEF